MLLQFSVENFQSIKKRMTLDMLSVQGKAIEEHKESLINGKVLPKAVIYGPNGGGKSTMIRAFQTMQALVARYFQRRGGIFVNQSLPSVFIMPFKFDDESRAKPTVFEVFIGLGKFQYKYGMAVAQNGAIKQEYLYQRNGAEPKLLFNRTEQKIEIKCEDILEVITNKMAETVAPNMPLLVFVNQFYKVSPIKEIVQWFLNTLFVDYNDLYQEVDLMRNIFDTNSNKEFKQKIINMLKEMDVKIDNYEILEKKKTVAEGAFALEEVSFDMKTMHNVNGKVYDLPFMFESGGTKKILGLIPLFISALVDGRTMFVDELDAKLHPKLLEQVIKLFSDKSINIKGGQLIFTSHDVATMKAELFRRDEIYFMALSENQDSEMFSLVEIRGKDGRVVRNDGSFSKQYLEGRYGADPYFAKIKSW